MKHLNLFVLLIALTTTLAVSADPLDGFRYEDATKFRIINKGWDNTSEPFTRLPQAYMDSCRKDQQWLYNHSSGIAVRRSPHGAVCPSEANTARTRVCCQTSSRHTRRFLHGTYSFLTKPSFNFLPPLHGVVCEIQFFHLGMFSLLVYGISLFLFFAGSVAKRMPVWAVFAAVVKLHFSRPICCSSYPT